MRESLLLLLWVVLCCQMCGNPIRNSEARDDANDKDSSSIERVFISDRLQDSLMNFLRLVDTSDYYVISKSPGKYCRYTKSDHSYNVVTLCCFTNDNDTIINFYGGIDGRRPLVRSSKNATPSWLLRSSAARRLSASSTWRWSARPMTRRMTCVGTNRSLSIRSAPKCCLPGGLTR